jgi:hypothetical protein
VSLIEVEEQDFDPSSFTFKATYKLKFYNNNLLLRKRIKYPSICINKNGKILECPLSDLNGDEIDVINIPAKKSETIRATVNESNPPFTDIGEFTYNLSYYQHGSKKPVKVLISANNSRQ